MPEGRRGGILFKRKRADGLGGIGLRLPEVLRPLLGSGMPDAHRLRPNKVPKILNT